jgi:hypothetical protein
VKTAVERALLRGGIERVLAMMPHMGTGRSCRVARAAAPWEGPETTTRDLPHARLGWFSGAPREAVFAVPH